MEFANHQTYQITLVLSSKQIAALRMCHTSVIKRGTADIGFNCNRQSLQLMCFRWKDIDHHLHRLCAESPQCAKPWSSALWLGFDHSLVREACRMPKSSATVSRVLGRGFPPPLNPAVDNTASTLRTDTDSNKSRDLARKTRVVLSAIKPKHTYRHLTYRSLAVISTIQIIHTLPHTPEDVIRTTCSTSCADEDILDKHLQQAKSYKILIW